MSKAVEALLGQIHELSQKNSIQYKNNPWPTPGQILYQAQGKSLLLFNRSCSHFSSQVEENIVFFK